MPDVNRRFYKMKKMCHFIVCFCLGTLIGRGIADNNTHEYVLAALTTIFYIGEGLFRQADFKRVLKNTFKK